MDYFIIAFLVVMTVGGLALVWALVWSMVEGAVDEALCEDARKISGDRTECSCGVGWDTNDPYPPAGHPDRTWMVGVDADMRRLTKWVSTPDKHGMLRFECIAKGRVLMVVDRYGHGFNLQHSVGVEGGMTLRVSVPVLRAPHG
jgi:hypothetical protein